MTEVREGDILAEQYRVERILGVGPMGTLALATVGEKRFAIRVIPQELASVEVLLRAHMARRVRGEHIARVLEVARLVEGGAYVACEYVSGDDLAKVLRDRGPLPAEEISEIGLQACDALADLHKHQLVHGALDPTKLVVSKNADGSPNVKLLELGVPKPKVPGDPDLPLADPEQRWMFYVAPEHMAETRVPDPQIDLWSLGVILYELATGTLPFEADTLGELVRRVQLERPRPLRELRPELPASLVSIVERCLMGDIDRRCQDVSDISAVLAAIAPKRARALAARVELTLHGTLPSLQRIIRQEANTEPPKEAKATISNPPAALRRSPHLAVADEPKEEEPPGDAEPPEDKAPPPEDKAPPPEDKAPPPEDKAPPPSLKPLVFGGVALAGVIVVGGVLAMRGGKGSAPGVGVGVGVGVTRSTSATHDAGADARDEPIPPSRRDPFKR